MTQQEQLNPRANNQSTADMQEQYQSNLTTRNAEPKSELAPGNYNTVHADKGMVAIDHDSGIVTITFLNAHPIPQVRPNGPWGLQNIMWDIVGEVKISLSAFNAIVLYYVSVLSNGLDIAKVINQHLAEHPPTRRGGLSYGPLFISQGIPEADQTSNPSSTPPPPNSST